MTSPISLMKLRNSLSDLYPEKADARTVAETAGLNTALIDFNGKSRNRWHNILREAERTNRIPAVIEVALQDYSENDALLAAVEEWALDNQDVSLLYNLAEQSLGKIDWSKAANLFNEVLKLDEDYRDTRSSTLYDLEH